MSVISLVCANLSCPQNDGSGQCSGASRTCAPGSYAHPNGAPCSLELMFGGTYGAENYVSRPAPEKLWDEGAQMLGTIPSERNAKEVK